MIPNIVTTSLPVRIDSERSSFFYCTRGDVLGIVVRKHGARILLKFRNAIKRDGDFSQVEIDCEIQGKTKGIVCSVCKSTRDWHDSK